MNDSDRPVMTPGAYVNISITPPALPRVEDFVGRCFNRGLVEEARHAVQLLKNRAEELGQFYVTDERFEMRGGGLSGHTQIRAYYGESGNALAEACKIRDTINHYLRETIWSDYERSMLWID